MKFLSTYRETVFSEGINNAFVQNYYKMIPTLNNKEEKLVFFQFVELLEKLFKN